MDKLRETLATREEILLAILHGSFLKEYPFRDVDVALYVKDVLDMLDYKLMLDEELSNNLGYRVDVQILNHAPHYFVLNVFRNGVILLEKVNGLFASLYLRALDEQMLGCMLKS
ncbi:MAG: nucleotidyltransferase domain-containing protein [Aigarchaeota archaeon]|nr:nucleotidyltransferase domain-containing protein [Candidatus Pelearchaeum maunauluense]